MRVEVKPRERGRERERERESVRKRTNVMNGKGIWNTKWKVE